nr:hypothetical protein CTI12_AA040130 [Tanacetum cinerariifolium]
MYMHHESWLKSFGILVALTFSWAYVNFIYLSSCLVFHLVCNLQIIHFDDYGRLLETETDVLVFIEEHARLRHDLSKISHRFRIYLLLLFTVVTSSQFGMLFQITEFSDKVTFINGGDIAVSSIAQVVGLTLCLNAAAKISHRAQGIAAIATRWHALASCGPDDSLNMRYPNASLSTVSSESDLEALNYIPVPTNTQLTSNMTSYHRRQAFVMYLQNNPGGITLYGWTVDRSLINTIFFIELSLVLFVLGRTTKLLEKQFSSIATVSFALRITSHLHKLHVKSNANVSDIAKPSLVQEIEVIMAGILDRIHLHEISTSVHGLFSCSSIRCQTPA